MANDDVKLSAATLVNDLYAFRDRYFEHHDVGQAERKSADVAREMERVIAELDKLKVCARLRILLVFPFMTFPSLRILLIAISSPPLCLLILHQRVAPFIE